jgi:hypothetical protein
LALTLLCFGTPALATDAEGPRQVAEQYLKALTDNGDPSGKKLLLGGVSMTAQLFTIENWKVVSESPVRNETGDLKTAVTMMRDLDRSGKAATDKILTGGTVGDDLTMHELSQDEATKMLGPTKQKADKFSKTCPALAYIARVGKPLYWHVKNPIRPLLAQTGGKGTYKLEVHRYVIETREGSAQTPRQWPLRVLHFTSGDIDTGWKILPASDWAED